MKYYYRIADVWVQGSILWATIFCWIIAGYLVEIMLYIVAGWFFVSTILRAYTTNNKFENFYFVMVIASYITIICWPVAFVFPPLFWAAVFMIAFVIPLLAILHFVISIAELNYLKRIEDSFNPKPLLPAN